jgi:RHS repeat-associated protein
LGRNTKVSIKGPTETVSESISYLLDGSDYSKTILKSDGSTKIYKYDPLNRLSKVTDNAQGTLNYLYLSDGQNITRKQTKVGIALMNETIFDEVGNVTSLNEKQKGTTTFTYNALGEILTQIDANGNSYSYNYKNDGRLDNKVGAEGTYTYVYESGITKKHLIKEMEGVNDDKIEYIYNNLHRIITKKETYNNTLYETKFEHNQNGQETKYTYPSGFAINKQYSNIGILEKIADDNSGEVIWKLDEINSINKISKYTLGNNLSTNIGYDEYGRINSQNTALLESLIYDFNPHNGNLNSRSRNVGTSQTYTETFTYDELDRLVDFSSSNGSGLPSMSYIMEYDFLGKFKKKSDAGNKYNYNLKYQPISIEEPTPNFAHETQEITYNEFNKPMLIQENDIELSYKYNALQERYEGVWKNITEPDYYRKRTYFNNYEINEERVNGQTIIHKIHYINSPIGLAAIYVIDNSTNIETMNYVYTDHLGSIISVTNTNGTVIARQNFDPWGRRRNVQNYGYLTQNTKEVHNGIAGLNSTNPNLPFWLYRGYTGHEMLNEFTLINMNARLYDPVAGMMLSPDNVLQEPTNSQNYHKYAYCFNNPLKYNDPTGNYGDVPNVSQGMNSFNPYSGYNANIQTNYVSISNTTNSSTFNYQSTSISVNYTNQFNTFNYTSSYSSYNYTTPESVTWGYYESKSYSNNGVNILSSESKVEYSYPNYSEQFNDISWENSKTSTYAPIALSTAQSGGGRPDLGVVGNAIRDQAGSAFSQDMFQNYWLSGGNVNLSPSRFNSIVNAAGAVKGSPWSVTLSNGQPGVAKVHSFYNSSEYGLALGRATIYYNQAGTAVGFYDNYNFDPKPWGERSYENEIKTRAVNTAGNAYGATPFNIYYGIRP